MVTYANSQVNIGLPESYEEDDISERALDLSTRRGDEKCHCWTESDKDDGVFGVCAFASVLALLLFVIVFSSIIFVGKRTPLELGLSVTIVICALLVVLFVIFRWRNCVMLCVRCRCDDIPYNDCVD